MSWIKIRDDLHEVPEVYEIMQHLAEQGTSLDLFAITGRLVRWFTWINHHMTAEAPEAKIGEAFIDNLVDCRGFAKALVQTGWITIKGGTVKVKNYERHNGSSAKERALTQSRQFRHRRNSGAEMHRENMAKAIPANALACNGTSVTHRNGTSVTHRNAPTVTTPSHPVTHRRLQEEIEEREKREERRVEETPPPTNQSDPNPKPTQDTPLTPLEQFVDLPPEQRAAALQAKRQANLAERERHMAAMWEALAKKGIYPQGQERPPPSAQGAGSACRSTDPPIKRLEGGAFKEESGGSA
jgi:hypothetical protein